MTEPGPGEAAPPRPAEPAGPSPAVLRTRLDGPVPHGDVISRLLGLGFLTLNIVGGNPGAGTSGTSLVVAVLGGICLALWLVWTLAPWVLPERWLAPAALALPLAFGLVGAVLAGLVPTTAGAVFPAGAALTLAIRTRPAVSASLTTLFAAVVLTAGALSGHGANIALAWCAFISGLYGVGQARRARTKQLESLEQLVAETERANAEEAHSAALAERGRIAREIHDVLAHSLAALTVQLEAADALLTQGRSERAHGYVVKARRIAREGMVETRRAITALREDLPPLPALLDSLAENYRADTGADAEVTVSGEPRPLSAETALTVYRTAQESLTNVRKHAPGAKVALTLVFEPGETRLTVLNGPVRGEPSALAGTGGGYGLAGLRERAVLASGTLTAQAVPVDDPAVAVDDAAGPASDGGPGSEGWAVTLTIPVVN